MKNSSGSSSSTYLNLRSGSLFNLWKRWIPLSWIHPLLHLSLGNWAAPCLTTSWTSSTVKVRPFLSCTSNHDYQGPFHADSRSLVWELQNKTITQNIHNTCSSLLPIYTTTARRLAARSLNARWKKISNICVIIEYLTWVKTCCFKQFPFVQESVYQVWVVLGLMN